MHTEDPFQPFSKESDWIRRNVVETGKYGTHVLETINGWRIIHATKIENGILIITRDTRFLNAEMTPVSNAKQITAILTTDGSDFIFNGSQEARVLYSASLNSH